MAVRTLRAFGTPLAAASARCAAATVRLWGAQRSEHAPANVMLTTADTLLHAIAVNAVAALALGSLMSTTECGQQPWRAADCQDSKPPHRFACRGDPITDRTAGAAAIEDLKRGLAAGGFCLEYPTAGVGPPWISAADSG